jgi:hypothetical protein
MSQRHRFVEEIEEYLNLKEEATRASYSSAFSLFAQHYQEVKEAQLDFAK